MEGIENIEEKLDEKKVTSWSILGPKICKLTFNKFQGRPKVTDIRKKMLKLATEEIAMSVKESMPLL